MPYSNRLYNKRSNSRHLLLLIQMILVIVYSALPVRLQGSGL